MVRGLDDITSIRIRYQSPPPRSDEDAILFEGRGIGSYEPRHTAPDAYAAQDLALGKAEVLKASVTAASLSRRDSGMTIEEEELLEEIMRGGNEDRSGLNLTSPEMAFRAPPRRTSRKARLARTATPSGISSGPSFLLAATPVPELNPATPPFDQVTSTSASSSLSPQRRGSDRRRRARHPSSRDDLSINGTPKLDPTQTGTQVRVRQFKDKRGRWYEVDFDGRPDWAVEERVLTKTIAPAGGRRKSTWVERRGSEQPSEQPL